MSGRRKEILDHWQTVLLMRNLRSHLDRVRRNDERGLEIDPETLEALIEAENLRARRDDSQYRAARNALLQNSVTKIKLLLQAHLPSQDARLGQRAFDHTQQLAFDLMQFRVIKLHPSSGKFPELEVDLEFIK